jgi:hypothetical protein
MISCRRYGHAFNVLNIIRKFNKFHMIAVNSFFDNSFANSINNLKFLLLLNDSNLIVN